MVILRGHIVLQNALVKVVNHNFSQIKRQGRTGNSNSVRLANCSTLFPHSLQHLRNSTPRLGADLANRRRLTINDLYDSMTQNPPSRGGFWRPWNLNSGQLSTLRAILWQPLKRTITLQTLRCQCVDPCTASPAHTKFTRYQLPVFHR
jgi:hypothetical protein